MSSFHADIPPGVAGYPQHIFSGGADHDWMPFERTKDYTNAFIIHDEKVLLGYKKRGFGINMYNGFGGKVEAGETSHQAALRELEEEAGIAAPLEHAGTLFFVNEDSKVAFNIEIYRADEYTGVITETEEMRPEWFSLPSSNGHDAPPIPFERMWDDDIRWMPLLFSRTKFAGRADFKKEGDIFTLHKWWFGTTAGN